MTTNTVSRLSERLSAPSPEASWTKEKEKKVMHSWISHYSISESPCFLRAEDKPQHFAVQIRDDQGAC